MGKACDGERAYSRLVSAGNAHPPPESVIRGEASERARAGLPTATYEVTFLNNPEDPGFKEGRDSDFTLLVRSTGRGPRDATVTIEIKLTDTLCGHY